MASQRLITILMADDDPDDRDLAEEAFIEGQVLNPRKFVVDGVELLDYLHQRNGFTAESAPRPGIILLDLNMPKLSGSEALAEIKRDPELRCIPVVILTTSRSEEDVLRSYDIGASSFISKPVTLAAFVDVVKSFRQYWMEIVEIPDPEKAGDAHPS